MGSSFFARFCSMLNTGRSDLRLFARKFLQTCPGVPPTGSCKNSVHFIVARAALKKPEYFLKKSKASHSLVDTSFAPTDSPRPLKKQNSPCHPFPLVIGVSTLYPISTLSLDIASGIRGGENFGLSNVNQPVPIILPTWHED